MQIMLINNDGGGFADHIEVAEGTSVATLFSEKMPGRKASDYLIRVNRLPVTSDQILQSGDRISITATKIQGACAV
jgi:sulfur carrier protein ThiS